MYSLPPELLNSLQKVSGYNEDLFIASHQSSVSPVSVRINIYKPTERIPDTLKRVPWANTGWYLRERPVFTADPLFHAGCYYVQEASSMFMEYALQQCVDFSKSLRALDLCAAPGGKSTILSTLLNSSSLLVSNEVVKKRSEVLVQNLVRWGRDNFLVSNSDAAVFGKMTGVFDLLVTDVPCSGSGLFRKQPDALREWSIAHTRSCASRQKKIVEEVLPALKPGGILFYSTCSFSACENEEVVEFLLNSGSFELVSLTIPPDWRIVNTGLGYRFYPYNLMGEGFFCAILRKKGTEKPEGKDQFKKPKDFRSISGAEKMVLETFIDLNPEKEEIISQNGYKLLNNNTLDFIKKQSKHLYIREAGVSLGDIKQGKMVPSHSLALSVRLKNETHRLELNREMALHYLKKETFDVENTPPGLYLASYKGYGLGWLRILERRINNYLPLSYQILNKKITDVD